MGSLDDFVRHVMRTATVQVSAETGFTSVQCLVLETISEVTSRLISRISQIAAARAALARRSQVNMLDVLEALEELGMPLTDLQRFAAGSDDIPYPLDVPEFPLKKQIIRGSDFGPTPAHIPDFLPRFPPEHTYKFTPVFPERISDQASKRREIIMQKRQVETSLIKLDRAAQESGITRDAQTMENADESLPDSKRQKVSQ